MKRFFVTHVLGKDFVLEGSEHNHLANVLRIKNGEQIIICCGDKYDYIYKITKITKSFTEVSFIEKVINAHNPNPHITVFLAFIKQDKLTQVISQLNEIGVTELVLFNADRCNTSEKLININKANEIARQSCKQCGRSIPIDIVITHEEPDKAFESYDKVYFADENTINKDANKLLSITHDATHQKIGIIIGPEGGFTENERKKLQAAATPVSLGNRILRAETAAVYAASKLL